MGNQTMLLMAIAGAIVLILAITSPRWLPDTIRTLGKLILFVVGGALISIGVFNGAFFYAEPGYLYHVRTILGEEKVVADVGYNSHLFGRYNAWKRAMTVQSASNFVVRDQLDAEHDSDSSSAELPPLSITFLDQVDAKAFATVRFILPTDEEAFLKVARDYRTPSNLLRTALIPAYKETLNATAQLMGAEEFYSGGRTEFNTEFERQMTDGIYIVRRQEIVKPAPGIRTASANAALGEDQIAYGNDTQVVFKVQKITDNNGLAKRKPQKFTNYGISVVDARVTDMQPNKAFLQRMQLKQKASADRAIARERRIQEEQERLLAIAKGEREVAQRQASAKVEQIEKTTNAETDKQLALTQAHQRKEQADIDRQTAEIRLAQARVDAQSRQVAADAAAYEKRAILKADNALQQKLEAYVQAQRYWADAFARRQVPTTVFGSNGDTPGNDTDVARFMDLMTMKAVKDLSIDPTISGQADKTAN